MTSDPPQEENNLAYLETDWKLATVYTAFLLPKSHQDAVRLIYNLKYDKNKKAPVISHPQQWIKDARDLLMERDLIMISEQKLKSSILKANVDPIIQSLITKNKEMKKDLPVLEGVRLVLDSMWFRDFFTFENLHRPMRYEDGSNYEPFRDLEKTIVRDKKKKLEARNLEKPIGEEETKKLEVKNLENRIFYILYDIGYYCQNIRHLMRRHILDEFFPTDDPIFEELLKIKNFDLFLIKHQHEVPPCLIQTIQECIENTAIESIEKIYSKGLFSKIIDENSGFFMPTQIAIALRHSPCTRSVNTIDFGYINKFFSYKYRENQLKYEKSMGPETIPQK